MPWNQRFLDLFDRCLDRYRGGDHDFTRYYSGEELAFLSAIGHKPREFFDFVEDFAEGGDPPPSTALLVASVRRDYFLVKQRGVTSKKVLLPAQLPTFGDELGGIAYLPRILAKARAKLRGELDPDIMYGCGGDRRFLREHGNIHPADFLRNVWAADSDDRKVLEYVKAGGGRS
jgi:hypothetical protein